jgi:hypothetical protein
MSEPPFPSSQPVDWKETAMHATESGHRTVPGLPPARGSQVATSDERNDSGAAAVRAQFLATEHWSLLGSRSLIWAEVMGRITAQFTFASASLVALALTQQAVGLSGAFRTLAVWLALSVLVTGSLTALRVRNASQEDLMLVAGMNRLRGAYVEMEPAIRNYLVTGATDDPAGIRLTYGMGVRRSGLSHFLASAYLFASTVNAIVAAGIAAIVADTAGANEAGTWLVSAAGALTYAGIVVLPTHKGYRDVLEARPQIPPPDDEAGSQFPHQMS